MDSVFFDDVFVGLFDQCQVREELSSRFLSKLRRCEDWIRVLFFYVANNSISEPSSSLASRIWLLLSPILAAPGIRTTFVAFLAGDCSVLLVWMLTI